MRILDIDLDFFLDNIAHWVNDQNGRRLNENEYCPWSPDDVRHFLENNCGLSRKSPVPGQFVVHHHEAFKIWRQKIAEEFLSTPFEIVHVDAHSDTGLGDSSFLYIMTNLLHKPVEERHFPENLYPGNYLAYAIACQWVKKITFVTHPKWRNDITRMHLKDLDPNAEVFQLKKYDPQILNSLTVDNIDNIAPLGLEPEVPFEVISSTNFHEHENFNYIILSQSPGYTPESADNLIPVIMEYIK